MGLIDSPRLTRADRDHWARLTTYDRVLAADPHLDTLADRARHVIAEFAAAGPCYVSVSWGKDSVVVADLAATSGTSIPLVFARARHWETPEVDQVRDAFLATHPDVDYREIEFTFRVPLRGEPGFEDGGPGQDALAETLGPVCDRRVSGVRAEESRLRRLSARAHGDATARSCRPILWWNTAAHIFPWLHRRDLPVHPLYAMTVGGAYDRRWLRVHALGCEQPSQSAVYGKDMETWESRYYPDVLASAVAARADMWRDTGA